MNGSLKVVQGFVLLSLLTAMFSSCGGSQTTLSSTASGTVTTSGTTTTSGTSENEEEEKNATIPAGYSASNLFVTVPDTIDYLNFTSITGDWASRCSFTSSSVVNDLTCNFEVNELALFHEGIKFQYNVPANSCKYIATNPYWYWNSEVGVGPTDVTVTVTKDASGITTSQMCTVDGSAAFACNNLAAYPTAAQDVQIDVADEIDVKCNYDDSDTDGGVNCCFGKYRLRTVVNTPDSSTSTDERGKDWGGSVASCIGGAGRTSWDHKTKDGYPQYWIEKMLPNTARTKIVKVEPTIEKSPSSGSNLPIANYFTLGSHTHSGYGATSGTITSVYPYYVVPVSDRSGSRMDGSKLAVFPVGSPYYLFDCLDEAFEVNFRIRVMVQEWDTVDALLAYKATGVSAVGPDEPGTAPTDCPGLAGEDCNQLSDADNFVATRSQYSNAVPSNRRSYFPRHYYE